MIDSISVILPAFNEARRLPQYLDSVRCYLERTFADAHEVLVIDDGSVDDTAGQVDEMTSAWPQLRSVRLDRNCGKGAALRHGAQGVHGAFVLFADADGATPIAEEAKLRRALLEGADVAIGSRVLKSQQVQRSRMRAFTGALFARAVWRVLDLPVRDTQCGFKMFRRGTCQELFGRCRETGYLIDLELLLLARRRGLGIAEIGVEWQDMPGSKVRLFRDGWRMLTGLWRMRQIAMAQDLSSRTPSARVNGSRLADPPGAGGRPLDAAPVLK